jgi:uncharacterized membrane protein
MARTKFDEANARLRDQMRNRLRREAAGRAGVAVFVVSSVNAIEAFTARRGFDSRPGAVGVLDDEGRVRTATATITIGRPVEEVYAFIRDFGNFPRFMAHLDSVETHGEDRSRWRLRTIVGRLLEWDVELVEDRPAELVAWRSLPGSTVESEGTIRLLRAPGGRGTEVHADIRYVARAGSFGVMIAKLLGLAPGQQAKADLRRLKQVLETGEVVHSDASIHRLMHAAQPPTDEFVEAA